MGTGVIKFSIRPKYLPLIGIWMSKWAHRKKCIVSAQKRGKPEIQKKFRGRIEKNVYPAPKKEKPMDTKEGGVGA